MKINLRVWYHLNKKFPLYIRSEQDKEPEQDAVSEVVGPGPCEESGTDDGMWLVLELKHTLSLQTWFDFPLWH